jgi:hypothetical protein
MNELALLINKAPLPIAYRDACAALTIRRGNRLKRLGELGGW